MDIKTRKTIAIICIVGSAIAIANHHLSTDRSKVLGLSPNVWYGVAVFVVISNSFLLEKLKKVEQADEQFQEKVKQFQKQK